MILPYKNTKKVKIIGYFDKKLYSEQVMNVRVWHIVAVFVVIGCGLMGSAYAQDTGDAESNSKKAEVQEEKSLKNECPAGRERCRPLEFNKEKYGRCMFLMCGDMPAKSEEEPEKSRVIEESGTIEPELTEGQKTCEIGLRKCNAIRNNLENYWVCMEESCNDKALLEKDPNCEEGHKECAGKLTMYRECVRLICKLPPGVYHQTCPAGTKSCGKPLTEYWDCVSNSCLGSVDKYRNPAYVEEKDKEYPMQRGPDGKLRRVYEIGDPNMPRLGVHPKYQYAPPGVSQAQWETGYIPEEVRVTNDLLQKVECQNRNSTIMCHGDHIYSCVCSDGTRPKMKK